MGLECNGRNAASACEAQPPAETGLSWVACRQRLPACTAHDAEVGVTDAGDAEPTPLFSPRMLVTVTEPGQPPFVSLDRVATIEGCGEIWWERFGQRVTHWMPLPPPATPAS